MNKPELVAMVAARTGATKGEVDKILNAAIASIVTALNNEEKVQIVGFGALEVKTRKARSARNPQTGEAIEVPAKRVPVFTAGSRLKELVA